MAGTFIISCDAGISDAKLICITGEYFGKSSTRTYKLTQRHQIANKADSYFLQHKNKKTKVSISGEREVVVANVERNDGKEYIVLRPKRLHARPKKDEEVGCNAILIVIFAFIYFMAFMIFVVFFSGATVKILLNNE
jgi:hypothetical protein